MLIAVRVEVSVITAKNSGNGGAGDIDRDGGMQVGRPGDGVA